MATLHITVRGKVQGVFFRATARRMAEKTGITGEVRNMEEGHVEIWASGSEQQLKEFLAWCRQGPSGARVDDVQAEPVEDRVYTAFVIVYK